MSLTRLSNRLSRLGELACNYVIQLNLLSIVYSRRIRVTVSKCCSILPLDCGRMATLIHVRNLLLIMCRFRCMLQLATICVPLNCVNCDAIAACVTFSRCVSTVISLWVPTRSVVTNRWLTLLSMGG